MKKTESSMVFLGICLLFSCSNSNSSKAITGKWIPVDLNSISGNASDTADFLSAASATGIGVFGPDTIEFRSDSLFTDNVFKANYQVKDHTIEFKRYPDQESRMSKYTMKGDTLILEDFPEQGLKISLKAI